MNINALIEIINEYADEKDLSNIHKHFSELIDDLRAVKSNIIDKVNLINQSDEIDDSSIRMNDDIVIIKSDIIKLKELKSKINSEMSDERDNSFIETDNNSKNIKLYLTDEDLCPACDVKLKDTITHFTPQSINGKIKSSINTMFCEACRRYFVNYLDIDGINFDKTNIELCYDYFNIIDLYDVIVVSNILSCSSKGHHIKDVTALLKIILPDGQIKSIVVTLAYCEECNRYFMMKYNYELLEGVPICEIIDETKEATSNKKEFGGKASKLNNLGYNVNCIENLSDIQRRIILALQLESQSMTKSEIESYLHFQIEKFSSRENCKTAITKWKSDLEYVSKYKVGEGYISGKINKFILKYTKHTTPQ